MAPLAGGERANIDRAVGVFKRDVLVKDVGDLAGGVWPGLDLDRGVALHCDVPKGTESPAPKRMAVNTVGITKRTDTLRHAMAFRLHVPMHSQAQTHLNIGPMRQVQSKMGRTWKIAPRR